MFKALGHWLKQILGSSQPDQPGTASLPQYESNSRMAEQFDSIDAASHLVPYDENLLERARTQWQFGDWHSLAKLDRDTLQHHPDRAKLVLLAAAGRLQIGQDSEARQYIRLAQVWGCSQKHISQILIAGVHNTIGRAAAIDDQLNLARLHFESAIQTGTPGADAKLLTQARTAEQLNQLGLGSSAGYHNVIPLLQPLTFVGKAKDLPKPEVAPQKEQQKFSSDADIDDFIKDIAPFFRNQSIVYVDVGAYIGEVFTKIMDSNKIKIREAHLIEPNPESYKKLLESIKNIKIPSSNTYPIAISNNPDVAKFKAAKSMTKRVKSDVSSQSSTNIFEAQCRKLDEISEHFTDGRVHLMKLDVEGEELDVLKSAKHLLEAQLIDVIYVEVGFNQAGTQQTYFGDLDAILQSYGYRVFKIYEQKNEWIDDSPLLRRCNAAYMSSRFESIKPYSFLIKQELANSPSIFKNVKNTN
jgi:FkbM family methyltransferase